MSTIEEELFEYNNTEITRKAVIEAGRRKLDEIRDLGRGILQEHYTDRAQNRISSKEKAECIFEDVKDRILFSC